MKGTRLKDVLDDKPINKKTWDIIFGKLKKLGTAIEMYWGDHMNIDDVHYRWVNDRIEYYEAEDRLLTKEEMETANQLWKKYGK
jgi:hypothetical protein|tara:strand:+ start:197 stop:448 length:252 start_codon:yes stop_codon:yes gene_type:complete